MIKILGTTFNYKCSYFSRNWSNNKEFINVQQKKKILLITYYIIKILNDGGHLRKLKDF